MGISAEAMKKLVKDKMFDLKIRIDKDPKFKALFENNFEFCVFSVVFQSTVSRMS